MGESSEVAQQAPERREVQREKASETGVDSLLFFLRTNQCTCRVQVREAEQRGN